MEVVRLNSLLAKAGIGSRRVIGELIKQGRVEINGNKAQLNSRVDPRKDIIYVDDKKINLVARPIYIILNKPKGIISTTKDEFNRGSVIDLVASQERVYPVGRLDANTSGLILLTNDGELTYHLTHPKFHIAKTYHLTVQGEVSDDLLAKLQQGVKLKEGLAKVDEVKIIKFEHNRTVLELVIHQGWNHQIKRMCAILGLNLISLKRVAVGKINLGNLAEGKFRYLTEEEVKLLK